MGIIIFSIAYVLGLYNNIYFHNCRRAAAFIGTRHSSHQQVIRDLVHPVKKVNDDNGNLGETPFCTTPLISYISLITKCARITVSQEVQGSSKTCCMRPNFGLIKKGGKLLCHGANAYFIPNFLKMFNCTFQLKKTAFSVSFKLKAVIFIKNYLRYPFESKKK